MTLAELFESCDLWGFIFHSARKRTQRAAATCTNGSQTSQEFDCRRMITEAAITMSWNTRSVWLHESRMRRNQNKRELFSCSPVLIWASWQRAQLGLNVAKRKQPQWRNVNVTSFLHQTNMTPNPWPYEHRGIRCGAGPSGTLVPHLHQPTVCLVLVGEPYVETLWAFPPWTNSFRTQKVDSWQEPENTRTWIGNHCNIVSEHGLFCNRKLPLPDELHHIICSAPRWVEMPYVHIFCRTPREEHNWDRQYVWPSAQLWSSDVSESRKNGGKFNLVCVRATMEWWQTLHT